MPTVHVDLRELSGLPDDAVVPFASLRVAPFTDDAQTIKILDGIGEFDTPATGPGEHLIVVEYGFRGAQVRRVTIPAGTDVNYGDLVEVTI